MDRLVGLPAHCDKPEGVPATLPTDKALAKVDAWLSAGTVSVIVEKPNHWRVLRGLLADAGTAGNLTTDAHLAAIAITHEATLVSCDGDFARFRDLRWENPLHVA